MMQTQMQKFDWAGELHHVVVKSLTTTFGLDFLLFEDKKGGDVNTIHNVRQGVWATDNEQKAYENRGAYDSTPYHQDGGYIAKGRSDKQKQQEGTLKDQYRNSDLKSNEKRQLDHVISAHEIHDDAGRVLAEVDGVLLASQDINLISTLAYVNTKKSDKSVEQFVSELPKMIDEKHKSVQLNQQKLKHMPENTPQERHEKQKVKDKIKKEQEHIEALESVDKKAMLKADQKARAEYNSKIESKYYMSSKFFTQTAQASVNQGFRMGVRQAVGLVLAEIWFEFKEQSPKIYQKCKTNFDLKVFLHEIGTTLKNIWERIKVRFNDLLTSFRDGFLGGILSSITTTIFNIFLTSQKMVGKLIREAWQSLVESAKLVFFNPKSLSTGDLVKEVTRLLSTGLSISLGVVLNQYLVSVMTFPFGAEIAAFISALATGVMIVGITYFFDYSPLMQKVWAYLNQFKSKYERILEHFKEINQELDRYLLELSRIEFNLDPHELTVFANGLSAINDEYQRSLLLNTEIHKRKIELPFEVNNTDSVRSWLAKL